MKKKIDLRSYLGQMHYLIGWGVRQHLLNYIPGWGFILINGFNIKNETLKPNIDNHVRSHISSEQL